MNHSPVRRVVKIFLFILLGVMIAALFGWVVMSLWNWLTPALFGWRTIGYWQAFGLIVLCRLLFGGVGGPQGAGGRWRHRMRERWERMTPEERESFRERMCAHGVAPPPDPSPSR